MSGTFRGDETNRMKNRRGWRSCESWSEAAEVTAAARRARYVPDQRTRSSEGRAWSEPPRGSLCDCGGTRREALARSERTPQGNVSGRTATSEAANTWRTAYPLWSVGSDGHRPAEAAGADTRTGNEAVCAAGRAALASGGGVWTRRGWRPVENRIESETARAIVFMRSRTFEITKKIPGRLPTRRGERLLFDTEEFMFDPWPKRRLSEFR